MNTEREAFEKWYCDEVTGCRGEWVHKDDSGEYYEIETRKAWQAWQAALANKLEAEPVAKYTGMGRIKWLKDGEMSLNQLLYTTSPSTAALQKRIEELEANFEQAIVIAKRYAGSINLEKKAENSIRALKAGDVQAPKEVVYKLTDAQIEAIALLDKYWVGGFRNEKFDWMNFAKDVLKQAAPTDTEGK